MVGEPHGCHCGIDGIPRKTGARKRKYEGSGFQVLRDYSVPVTAGLHTIPFGSTARLGYTVRMKTTVDIPTDLLTAVQVVSGKRTKKAAITTALEEFLRIRRSQELVRLLGTFVDFMDNEELESQRGSS